MGMLSQKFNLPANFIWFIFIQVKRRWADDEKGKQGYERTGGN